MLKQAKIQYRCENARTKSWAHYHGDLMISCSDEHKPFLRVRRDALASLKAWYYDRENHFCGGHPLFKSWKSRCRKRHQWEPHFHSKDELFNNELCIGKWASLLKKTRFKYPRRIVIGNSGDELIIEYFDLSWDIKKPENKRLVWHLRYETLRFADRQSESKTAKQVSREAAPRPRKKWYWHHTGKIPQQAWPLPYQQKSQRKPEKTESRWTPFVRENRHWGNPESDSPLLALASSLPRKQRRSWCWWQWDLGYRTDDAYISFLKSAFRHNLKVFFIPQNAEDNLYARSMYELLKARITADPDFGCSDIAKIRDADRQFQVWIEAVHSAISKSSQPQQSAR